MIKGLIDLIKTGKYPIKQGFTFMAKLPEGSDRNHYCIIINKKVTKHTTIFYFFMTSQGEKVKLRMRNDKKAFVSLNSTDYKPLTKPTFIQCDKGHIFSLDYSTLINGLESGNYTKEENVDSSIITKILSAVNLSKTYTFEEKKNFPDNYDPWDE